jgi:hypothetical protein
VPLVPELRRQKQTSCYEFEAILVHIMHWASKGYLMRSCLKIKKKKKQRENRKRKLLIPQKCKIAQLQLFKKLVLGAEEMARQLRALTALPRS